jgi:streptogramin lyase
MKLYNLAAKSVYGVLVLLTFLIYPSGAQTISQIIDLGDGLDTPYSMAVDGSGNLYVVGHRSHNVLKFDPDTEVISEIIDATGDGDPEDGLTNPYGIAVDGVGNVYVSGSNSNNVFKITPDGVITEIVDYVSHPYGIAVDDSGNLYIAVPNGSYALKITPEGVRTEIIASWWDGITLKTPTSIAVDGSDSVYVAGLQSNNVFQITPGGVITEIINGSGDGVGNTLYNPWSLTVDGNDNVYVSGHASDNVFKITPEGVKTLIIDINGDPEDTNPHNWLKSPRDITVDNSGNVYVAGNLNSNAFKINPDGDITQIINATGDSENPLTWTYGIAVDGFGNVYVSGQYSDNVFKITPALPADSEGPVTSDVAIYPVPINTNATLTATLDDSTTGNSDIASAEYGKGESMPTTWYAMESVDSFDSPTEDVTVNLGPFSEPGIHKLWVRGTDVAGNTGEPVSILLAVYDPSGGFVTGGGWIDSPLHNNYIYMGTEGKANFGFVSKYKKGAEVPTGNTEFVFHAGGLNFHSSSYQWLVVNQGGANAQFKGTGTINGAGDYKFMLWAGDGEPDTFRIKIWEELLGEEIVYYDNDKDQSIGGGNIIVHKK